MITLYARQQKRHRCIEQSFGLCGRGRGWDDLGEWRWNLYNIIYEMNRQSRFDAGYWMLGAGALGWLRGTVWGRKWEGGSVVVERELSCSAAYGIFPDQRWKLCLMHYWQVSSLSLSHQESTVDILDQIILSCGRLSVNCGMFSSIPAKCLCTFVVTPI